MKNIWAPWRMEYIAGPKASSCILCEAPKTDDPLIITSERDCYAIMNRFPYAAGHCMVVPYRHVGDLAEMSEDELRQTMSLVTKLMSAIRAAMKPEGFNIGCNIGTVAGAGIADHVHMHVVPRWNGDTNFMPVLGGAGIISEHILKTRDKIARNLA